jgi:CheY-like chemotaxis protein
MPADLDVLADGDLETGLATRVQALCPEGGRLGTGLDSRVLVVGADVTWRRRVSLILEARGIRTAEVAHIEEAFSVARRLPVRGIVADLLLPDPGSADLLSRFDEDETLRDVPVLLVGPGALSPRQQRDLRRELARWARERPVPVSELAGSIANMLAGHARRARGDAAHGAKAWLAH